LTVIFVLLKNAYYRRDTIDFTKEGHLPSTTIVDSELSGWYFGNLLFGGIIGLAIVDPISGKMWTLPDNANGNLTTSK